MARPTARSSLARFAQCASGRWATDRSARLRRPTIARPRPARAAGVRAGPRDRVQRGDRGRPGGRRAPHRSARRHKAAIVGPKCDRCVSACSRLQGKRRDNSESFGRKYGKLAIALSERRSFRFGGDMFARGAERRSAMATAIMQKTYRGVSAVVIWAAALAAGCRTVGHSSLSRAHPVTPRQQQRLRALRAMPLSGRALTLTAVCCLLGVVGCGGTRTTAASERATTSPETTPGASSSSPPDNDTESTRRADAIKRARARRAGPSSSGGRRRTGLLRKLGR